jgi:hypothetical protein
MKCKACGSEVTTSQKYCTYCGEYNEYFLFSEERQSESQSNLSPLHYGGNHVSKPLNRKKITAAKVVGIYSIVFGTLSFLGNEQLANPLTIIMQIIMIVFGIMVTVFAGKGEGKEKGFLITLFVFYCIIALSSFAILAIPDNLIPAEYGNIKFFLFILCNALIITPFIFSIIYFSASKKEY